MGRIIQPTNKGLSYFTTLEAESVHITKANEVSLIPADGGASVFSYWAFGVEDEWGNIYEWKDYDLESGASKAQIGRAIVDYLRTNMYKINYSEIESESLMAALDVGDSDHGVGERVKDTL